MVRRFPTMLAIAIGLMTFVAPVLIARSGESSRGAKDAGPITKETAARRLKRNPIIKAAIGQAESFVGAKSCVVNFLKLRELTQFEPGSAFEYQVRIMCQSKGEFEKTAIIEVEGQSLNYGEPHQDIDRLSFHMAV
jgi:hypothetical protein